MMLNAVTLKRLGAPVVHVHRQCHGDRPLRIRRPFAVALVDAQIIGDDTKLLASHLENFVVVNRVHRCVSAALGLHGKAAICAGPVASSTGKLWTAATCRGLGSARVSRAGFGVAQKQSLSNVRWNLRCALPSKSSRSRAASAPQTDASPPASTSVLKTVTSQPK